MKIKKLEIRNALGVKQLDLEPGKLTMIQGGSEKGKSSIIEAIEKAVYNTNRRVEFVRAGENEALVYIEFDNGIDVTRKIRKNKSDYIKVTKDGAVVTSPESFLKSLTNGYAFNPISFMNHSDKEQTDLLLGLIPLNLTPEMISEWLGELPPINTDEHGLKVLKSAEKYYYSKRTEANRELKTTETQFHALSGQLPVNYDPAEWADVSLQVQYEQIATVKETLIAIEESKETIAKSVDDEKEIQTKFGDRISRLEAEADADKEKIKRESEKEKSTLELEISELQKKIEARKARLESFDSIMENKISTVDERFKLSKEHIEKTKQERLESIVERVEKAKAFLNAAFDVPDLEKLKEKAEHAEKMKGFLRVYENVEAVKTKLEELKKVTENYDIKIGTCRTKPAELLAQKKMPVNGLGINDSFQVTIDGLPIKNLSTSRQMQLALEIARTTAGDLKLICVDQFESLDADRRKEFLEAIEDDNFEYFITQVTNGELSISTEKTIDKEATAV